jgi:ferredoxin
MMPDGLAYVQENGKIYAAVAGNLEGSAGLASFSDDRIDDVIEAADDCPGECIFIEP